MAECMERQDSLISPDVKLTVAWCCMALMGTCHGRMKVCHAYAEVRWHIYVCDKHEVTVQKWQSAWSVRIHRYRLL